MGWKCVIAGCSSPAKAPGHFFPKNKEIRKRWLESLSMPWLSNLPEEEIRKCRICHLHFSENSYIFTLNRRRLKYDAIPTENLSNEIIETSQTNTSQIEKLNSATIDIYQPSTSKVQAENRTDIFQPSTSQVQEENTSRINMNIEKEAQEFDPEILKTPESFHRVKHVRRNILDHITRKDHLTPIAKKLYTKSRTFQIQNNALRRNLIHYKQRLKYATKFSSLTYFKKYSALTNT